MLSVDIDELKTLAYKYNISFKNLLEFMEDLYFYPMDNKLLFNPDNEDLLHNVMEWYSMNDLEEIEYMDGILIRDLENHDKDYEIETIILNKLFPEFFINNMDSFIIPFDKFIDAQPTSGNSFMEEFLNIADKYNINNTNAVNYLNHFLSL
jgi:hypothetical protein